MKSQSMDLLSLLKEHFGFSSFRPLQEEVIRDILLGRDVFALLPTGGGKSLCYQLAALAKPGLTVVVSPLIALMKDQVDALKGHGVASVFLNSSLEPHEARARLRGLYNSEYRLLYVAPERLAIPGFLEDLTRWKVSLFAIDEAHCISEWGHDFRPEYRQLAGLRQKFPDVPILAVTATATSRVQEDIVKLLGLRDPGRYTASFNRPNLHYRVIPKSDAYEQALGLIRQHSDESGIVYCQSRKTTEMLARRLTADGIAARPYHAGLEVHERTENQELFLRDVTRVICATIAFGMGINKSNVRFVLHYDLPKNLEAYYQETGRAGRDGLPSDCLLLFSPADAFKQRRFIENKTDAKEREIASRQLEQMIEYAEGVHCRRKDLLRYFGEEFPGENCGACDHCRCPRTMMDATEPAQKLLSCVYRIRQKNGFPVGLAHVVDVLMGGNTERVRRWEHHKLSTFGLGTERPRAEWLAFGRELVRAGYLRVGNEKFKVIELTEEGMKALKERRPILLQSAPQAAQIERGPVPEAACDEELLKTLRSLRSKIASETNMAAHIVFSDVALRQMCREYPVNDQQFRRISGVSDRKLQELGPAFMGEIRRFLESHPRQIFAATSFRRLGRAGPVLGRSAFETLQSFRAGRSALEIASERKLAVSTIYGHLAEAIELGETGICERLVTPEQRKEIEVAFEEFGMNNLGGVADRLGHRYEFGLIRVVRAASTRPDGINPATNSIILTPQNPKP